MKLTSFCLLLIALACAARAQNTAHAPNPAHARNTVVTYQPSTKDFPNPERGFYIPIGTSASHFVSLDSAELRAQFAGPQKHGIATYAICSPLLMREDTLVMVRGSADS